MPLDRRHFLRSLGRSAAALALGSLFGSSTAPLARRAVDEPRWAHEPFTLGVASGMPRPESVVLWTRLAPRPLERDGGMPPEAHVVHWEVAEDESFAQVVRRGEVLARPEHAHSVHVEVTGLTPGRVYHYRFRSGDAWSRTGRTRTAPPEDADVSHLRIALASCQHYEQGHYAAHREIAAQDLDFVLFVGDYIYESSNPRYKLRSHGGPVPTRLEMFRRRHALYKLDPDLQAAHAAHPWVLTWDDHEVENDYASDTSWLGENPHSFLRRRAAAYKAYFEHLPVSPSMAPQGASMRIHERFVWGRLAELWTLDGRQYRSPQACPRAEGDLGGRVLTYCDELADEGRTVFGHAQEAWLMQGLAASTRRWKLLGQASQISSWGIDTPLGRSVYSDAWDGYPRARERLLRGLHEAGVRDVVALGGDVHRHVAAQLRLVPNDDRTPIVASEFVTSSITTRGLPEMAMALIRAANPDLVHARGDERGYALLDVRPQAVHCTFRATEFPVLPQARLRTQAAFAAVAGVAGVQRDL